MRGSFFNIFFNLDSTSPFLGYLMELSVNLQKTQNVSHVKSELLKKQKNVKY